MTRTNYCHPDYPYGHVQDEPPPMPDPMPPMTSVFEFHAPAFDDDEPRRPWWVRLARLWRR
jgi:hypothetical protein